MYYLINWKESEFNIIKNFVDYRLKLVHLIDYLEKNEITFIEIEENLKLCDDGKYCYQLSHNKYRVVEKIVIPDGYIYSGKTKIKPVSDIFIIHYSVKADDKVKICNEIKMRNNHRHKNVLSNLIDK